MRLVSLVKPAVRCPGCGVASRRHTYHPWPPAPNPADRPLTVEAVDPWTDWRCAFCVEQADWGRGLRKRLRVQRRLIEAGAMRWPGADER
jgi:hypothetical protein